MQRTLVDAQQTSCERPFLGLGQPADLHHCWSGARARHQISAHKEQKGVGSLCLASLLSYIASASQPLSFLPANSIALFALQQALLTLSSEFGENA